MTSVFELAAGTGEASKAGPIGLAVILALCISCYFLFRSMSRHLRKVRRSFPVDDTLGDAQPGAVCEPDGRTNPPIHQRPSPGIEEPANPPIDQPVTDTSLPPSSS
jgi:hypothetical protein